MKYISLFIISVLALLGSLSTAHANHITGNYDGQYKSCSGSHCTIQDLWTYNASGVSGHIDFLHATLTFDTLLVESGIRNAADQSSPLVCSDGFKVPIDASGELSGTMGKSYNTPPITFDAHGVVTAKTNGISCNGVHGANADCTYKPLKGKWSDSWKIFSDPDGDGQYTTLVSGASCSTQSSGTEANCTFGSDTIGQVRLQLKRTVRDFIWLNGGEGDYAENHPGKNLPLPSSATMTSSAFVTCEPIATPTPTPTPPTPTPALPVTATATANASASATAQCPDGTSATATATASATASATAATYDEAYNQALGQAQASANAQANANATAEARATCPINSPTPTPTATPVSNPTPTVDLKANGSDGPIQIPYGTSANLTWTTTNAQSCWATPVTSWTGWKAVPNGSESTGNLTTSRTYTIQCWSTAGVASVPDSVTVNVSGAPTSNNPPIAVAKISINGEPASANVTVTRGVPVNVLLNSADSSDPDGWTNVTKGVSNGGTIVWNSDLNQGVPSYDTEIYNPVSPAAGNYNLGTLVFNDAPGTYTYNLLRIYDVAHGQSNIAAANVTIYAAPTPTPTATPVSNPTPTVDLKANGSDGPIQIPYGTSANLTWTTTNAQSCWATPVTSWTGWKAVPNGSESTGNLTTSRTYAIQCWSTAGVASVPDSVTVNVSGAPTPTATPIPPIYECNNGADDDGDGKTDASDPGCHINYDPSQPWVPTDNDETNPPTNNGGNGGNGNSGSGSGGFEETR